jgi:AraC-like DNA-binding protein
MHERVRTCAMEILASGECSIDEVARRLGVSARSLQRKLSAEGTSFQKELNLLREDLACHYLTRTHHSAPEVAFLLGYQDTNSFYRAFNGWTGQTPEQVRAQATTQ